MEVPELYGAYYSKHAQGFPVARVPAVFGFSRQFLQGKHRLLTRSPLPCDHDHGIGSLPAIRIPHYTGHLNEPARAGDGQRHAACWRCGLPVRRAGRSPRCRHCWSGHSLACPLETMRESRCRGRRWTSNAPVYRPSRFFTLASLRACSLPPSMRRGCGPTPLQPS